MPTRLKTAALSAAALLIFASAAFIAFTSLVSPCAWSAHDPQGWLYGPRESSVDWCERGANLCLLAADLPCESLWKM